MVENTKNQINYELYENVFKIFGFSDRVGSGMTEFRVITEFYCTR